MRTVGIVWIILSVATFASTAQTMDASSSDFYAFRLKPGEDLRGGILAFAKEKEIKAGAIVTCVGSLTQLHLRFANQPNGIKQNGHFEIVSMTGTFSDTSSHLHLSVSDSTGKTIGGHLLEGNRVYTTAELVIVDLKGVEFTREVDTTFGYQELFIKPRKKSEKK